MDEEWCIPDPATPVRQGDLLISRDPSKGAIEGMALVITADCDISNRKYGKQLLCLRVIRFQAYLRTIWAEKKLKQRLQRETAKLTEQIRKWHSKQLGETSDITPTACMQWARDMEAEVICRELGAPAPDADAFAANVATYRNALLAMDGETLNDPFDRLLAFLATVSGQTQGQCLDQLLKQAQGEKKLSDDVFMLSGLPQLDCGAAVVLLREVIGLPFERVCYRTIDAVSSHWHLRIGRLEPTFKYAVSQSFGALYSRIGLPEAYECRCASALESIANLDWGT